MRLREEARTAAPLKVDRDKGIIFRVKILGPDSRNRRRYTQEAWHRAVSLYEDVKVGINHPEKGRARSAYDSFGILKNVQAEADGLYGDLHVLVEHEMAGRVFEDAEKGLGVFGLSHDAEGKGWDDPDGIFVVEEILEVRFVDVVGESATTKSLAESVIPQPKKTTIKRRLAEHFKDDPAAKKLALKILREMGEEYESMEVGDGGGADEEPEADDHLVSAIAALVKKNDPESHALAKKIMNLLKPEQEEETDEDEEPDKKDKKKHDDDGKDLEEDADGDDDGDEDKDKKKVKEAEACDDPDKKKMKESRRNRISDDPTVKQLQEQVDQLRAERDTAQLVTYIRTACDERRLTPAKQLLEACIVLKEKKKIAEHLDYLKSLREQATNRVRSAPPGKYRAPEEMDAKQFARSLMGD